VYDQSNLTTTTQTITGLGNTTLYYWHVRGENSAATGPWSPTSAFTTVAKPEQFAMQLSSRSLDFGAVTAYAVRCLPLIITSIGLDTLRIGSITFSNSAFKASVTRINIAPGASFTDSIQATAPGPSGILDGLAFIVSNAKTGTDTIALRLSVVLVDVGERDLHATPTVFALDQNYPNPFNPTTTIRFGLPHRSMVRLTVCNTLGQSVAELVNGELEAGYHLVQFNGETIASGVYLYRLAAGDFMQTKKFCLVR
jgi:hypothetical protein